MNHGKGHLRIFHHLVGWIFQINTPVINPGKGKLSNLVPWFSCLNALPSMDHFPTAASPCRCTRSRRVPWTLAIPRSIRPTRSRYPTVAAFTKSRWDAPSPWWSWFWRIEVMKCLKKIDELFKMAVILQYDTVSGFIRIFLLIQAKNWWLTSTSLWFVSIHGWLPPQKLANCSSMSQRVTPRSCKVSSFSIYFWGFLYIQCI